MIAMMSEWGKTGSVCAMREESRTRHTVPREWAFTDSVGQLSGAWWSHHVLSNPGDTTAVRRMFSRTMLGGCEKQQRKKRGWARVAIRNMVRRPLEIQSHRNVIGHDKNKFILWKCGRQWKAYTKTDTDCSVRRTLWFRPASNKETRTDTKILKKMLAITHMTEVETLRNASSLIQSRGWNRGWWLGIDVPTAKGAEETFFKVRKTRWESYLKRFFWYVLTWDGNVVI